MSSPGNHPQQELGRFDKGMPQNGPVERPMFIWGGAVLTIWNTVRLCRAIAAQGICTPNHCHAHFHNDRQSSSYVRRFEPSPRKQTYPNEVERCRRVWPQCKNTHLKWKRNPESKGSKDEGSSVQNGAMLFTHDCDVDTAAIHSKWDDVYIYIYVYVLS